VTGVGVEAVVEGCGELQVFDVSQCKNLGRWLEGGGVERCAKRWPRKIGGLNRGVEFLREKGEDGGLR